MKKSAHELEVDYRHLVARGDFYTEQEFKYDHLEPVNLTYQETVDVLCAHGADIAAGNYQVRGRRFIEKCYAGITGVAGARVYCMLIVLMYKPASCNNIYCTLKEHRYNGAEFPLCSLQTPAPSPPSPSPPPTLFLLA